MGGYSIVVVDVIEVEGVEQIFTIAWTIQTRISNAYGVCFLSIPSISASPLSRLSLGHSVETDEIAADTVAADIDQ
jgi:hypothetical protein